MNDNAFDEFARFGKLNGTIQEEVLDDKFFKFMHIECAREELIQRCGIGAQLSLLMRIQT